MGKYNDVFVHGFTNSNGGSRNISGSIAQM